MIFNTGKGKDGKSAYQIYVEHGGALTEAQWLASLAATPPEYAATVDDMTDTSKIYVGSNGHLWAYMDGGEPQPLFTNLVPTSKDKQGNIFNGTGYKNGYRGNSSGSESALANCTVSGWMPFNPTTDTIRVKGVDRSSVAGGVSADMLHFATYDEQFSTLMWGNATNWRGGIWYNSPNYGVADENEVYTIWKPDSGRSDRDDSWFARGSYGGSSSVKSIPSTQRWFRVCGMCDGANMIVTVNEEISYITGSRWQDTGIVYANYALTENDKESIAQKVLEYLDVTHITLDNVLTIGSYELDYGDSSTSSLGEVNNQ